MTTSAFTLTLEYKGDGDAGMALKLALKRLWRDHKLKCVRAVPTILTLDELDASMGIPKHILDKPPEHVTATEIEAGKRRCIPPPPLSYHGIKIKKETSDDDTDGD